MLVLLWTYSLTSLYSYYLQKNSVGLPINFQLTNGKKEQVIFNSVVTSDRSAYICVKWSLFILFICLHFLFNMAMFTNKIKFYSNRHDKNFVT